MGILSTDIVFRIGAAECMPLVSAEQLKLTTELR